jgi:polyhydroxyalkanoate depolymerase
MLQLSFHTSGAGALQRHMLYLAYQAHADVMMPMRLFAQAGLTALGPWAASEDLKMLRNLTAAYELITRAALTHKRPAYGIDTVRVGNRRVAVREEPIDVTPFGTLLHFRKDVDVAQPRLLVVAPLSGHFATLLRNLVRTLLPDHDVCITDWHNVRDVSTTEGRFGFDDYVDHLIRWLERLGTPVHVIAVCQPCVQVLAAAAVMAQSDSPAQPRSMTLMAGPIDTRINPTKVNELAMSRPIEWFETNLIAHVPTRYRGAGRRVYPGFVQLAAFMSMNIDRHRRAHLDLYESLTRGDVQKAKITKAFYDEYFAVLDLTAEFYLETVAWVFQEARLAKGELAFRGEPVEPLAIRRTALLTVEGERDDICALGQTAAAHDLCRGIKPYMRRHHMQAGVGHYGVFSGKRWEDQVYPIVRNMVLASE